MSLDRRRKRKPPGHRPWEQQPKEPAQAFAHFTVYLGLGPERSLAKASETSGLALSWLKQLSAEWNWLYRALAWDREQFLRRRREELQASEETTERLLRQSADLQRIAGASFRSWLRRDEQGEWQLVRDLSPSEAIRLWQVGSEALRELQGTAVTAAYQQTLPKPDFFGEHPTTIDIRQAAREAASCISYAAGGELVDALLSVISAWVHYYCDRHPDGDSLSVTDNVWPWDLPYAQA